jgi:hypothetical protein
MRGWGSALATSRLDKGCFGDGGLPLSPILADVQTILPVNRALILKAIVLRGSVCACCSAMDGDETPR